jgi:hypothetical protein
MQLWDSICWPQVNPVPSGAVGKDCQRRLLSRPRFVRACSATDYNAICEDNSEINCISVRVKRSLPSTLTDHAMLTWTMRGNMLRLSKTVTHVKSLTLPFHVAKHRLSHITWHFSTLSTDLITIHRYKIWNMNRHTRKGLWHHHLLKLSGVILLLAFLPMSEVFCPWLTSNFSIPTATVTISVCQLAPFSLNPLQH